MKNHIYLLLAAALVAGGCQSVPKNMNPASPGDVTVNFQDQNKFTDVRDSVNGQTSQYYLDELSKYVKETAARSLTAGEKLTVTFTDIDLAGDIPPGQINDIRIIKDIYLPRMTLNFKLQDAAGVTIKEGERRLTDLNYQQSISPLTNSNEPLRYDKALLNTWIKREFTP